MKHHTNTATLWLRAAALLTLAGRIQENELWLDDPFKRSLLDQQIAETLADIAEWAGFSLIKREDKQEAA